MKVLQVINSLNTGGAEKLLLDTIPLYIKKGIEMDVLVLNGTEYPFLKQLKASKCCSIISLGNYAVYNPIHIFKLMPYLKKYNCIHVHLFPAQYWVVFAKLLSFSKVKLIFTEHNTSNRRLNNIVFKQFDKIIYSFYSTIICISEEIQKLILHHSLFSKNNVTLISNGVAIEKFVEASFYQKDKIDFKETAIIDKFLIQVAGFRLQKDQQTLIKALQFLPEHIKLILVGDGPLRQQCELLVKTLMLEERVLFLGVRTDVPQLLKTADIVILSSKYEGLSLSSIEGMASGKPFIASNVPGLKDVVVGAGILFTQGNEKELATKIMELFNNENLYKKTAEACLQRAKQYDINTMVDKHIELYKKLTN